MKPSNPVSSQERIPQSRHPQQQIGLLKAISHSLSHARNVLPSLRWLVDSKSVSEAAFLMLIQSYGKRSN